MPCENAGVLCNILVCKMKLKTEADYKKISVCCHPTNPEKLPLPKKNFIGLPEKDVFFIPHHTKSGGVLCYTLRTLSVRPSVCPSALRFRALTLVPFDLFSSNFG